LIGVETKHGGRSRRRLLVNDAAAAATTCMYVHSSSTQSSNIQLSTFYIFYISYNSSSRIEWATGSYLWFIKTKRDTVH